jgi:exocyst complex component 4
LAQTTLFTLRLELRCHVIHFLNQTIREGNFGLTEDEVEEEELDPTIVELCKDLVSFENLLSATLEIQESKFILSELSCLIDQTLLSLACTITLLTSPGLGKLRRIILTLSQNLKHFTPQPQDALLNRSLEYFSLFSLGPAQFIQWAKETHGNGYDYDEMKTMLGLLYSEQMGKTRISAGGITGSQSGREKSLGVRRAYNDCLIQLNEALWDQ